jgi:exopolysaccharide biosynthesis polyprenyl glycosylphosphotransferase
VATRNLRPADLLFSADFQPNSFNMAVQSLYSLVLGAAGLVLALPLMAVLALLVKLTSPGPVLYRQKRVGLRGKTFELYKFRSMYIDAEARTGPVWARQGDPRVTPVGRWLRRFRLDELPQFFNVVRGDMSLVGPRPERPEFCKVLEEQIPFYAQRHVVKPGVTGWAQINHTYADSFEDSIVKLEYDLYYIRNLAPSLDAYIVFHTLKVMLLSRGAR